MKIFIHQQEDIMKKARFSDNLKQAGNSNVPLQSLVVQRILGHRGYGTGFEVRHGKSQQNLALKTIVRTGPSSEASQYSASINEVRVMKTLGHPHIVELLGFDIGPDCFSLLMAAVADTDVRRFLGTEVSLERSRGLKLGMCSIAAALGYIPSSPLQCSHMDIKPANILIDVGD